MKKLNKKPILKLTYAALCLALCMVLPFLTGQIPEIGSMLCPMHIPVLLAGFLCGPWWALAVGVIAPVLRFVLFSMPPIFPTGFAMCFELGVYGMVSGLFYNKLPKKSLNIYVSLLVAMICGRIVWGLIMTALTLGGVAQFTFAAFFNFNNGNKIGGSNSFVIDIMPDIAHIINVLSFYTFIF